MLQSVPRRALCGLASVFPRVAKREDIVTRATIDASPEEVWTRIAFYEEVPHAPPLLLRLLLPVPLRTSKPGLHAGAQVECSYSGDARLRKRITTVEPPSLLRFVVTEQQLGIESFVQTVEGSYAIAPLPGGGSEVALTTTYRGFLRPRWLWRAPERLLAGEVHRHILRGMAARPRG